MGATSQGIKSPSLILMLPALIVAKKTVPTRGNRRNLGLKYQLFIRRHRNQMENQGGTGDWTLNGQI